MEKLIIKKVNTKPFEGKDGVMIPYHWYKAFRPKDGVTIEFGGTQKFDIDQEVNIDLEKIETVRGGFRYKHVVPRELSE